MTHLGDAGDTNAVSDFRGGGQALRRHELHHEARQVLHELAVELLQQNNPHHTAHACIQIRSDHVYTRNWKADTSDGRTD